MSYEWQKGYRLRRREKAKAYLGGVCRCGATEGLEFDHIDPKTKVLEITAAIVAGWSWARLQVELDKCQLLCGVCHQDKTSAEAPGWSHGTTTGYRYGCRCDPCRKSRADYIRKYRQIRRSGAVGSATSW